MRKNEKTLLLFILGVAFACILYIWTTFSPTVALYRLIHNRHTEDQLAYAFTAALFTNHSDAYDMIDSALKPRLDEWMSNHQIEKCTRRPDLFLVGSETETTSSYNVSLTCYGVNGWVDLEVESIFIEDMKIIDWGEVRDQ